MEKIRYSYIWPAGARGIRDEYVLSIARVFNKEKKVVKFGWALNVPPKWVPMNTSKFIGEQLLPGDHFSRKAGRVLASQRLRERPMSILVQDGMLPIQMILEHMSKSDTYPKMAREIARSELNSFIR